MDESGPRPPPPGRECRKAAEGESLDYEKDSQQPYYLQWARTLPNLLGDRDGVELLKTFVEQEAPLYTSHLKFYFACEGLKEQTNQEKINQIIGAIYRLFFRKTPLLSLNPDLRRTIKAGLKNEIVLNQYVFDSLQENVEKTIREKIYPDFLRSDIYINYVQKMSASQEERYDVFPSRSISSNVSEYSSIPTLSNSSSGNFTGAIPKNYALPTLHENTELCDSLENTAEANQSSLGMPIRLTNDLLLATQIRRLDSRHQAHPGYMYTASTSYNPNSRVDSETQSISSGGRTDSETMSVLNCPIDVQKRRTTMEHKSMRQIAMANKETNTCTVIPRTQRMHSIEHRHKSEDFLGILIPKLEKLKSDQDMGVKLRYELEEEPKSSSGSRLPGSVSIPFQSTTRDKFSLDVDNDQDILDQHVSRVWQDRTPLRSPSSASPCPMSKRRSTTHEFDSMRVVRQHSNPISEQSFTLKKLTNKWPSTNTDSGISMFSADFPKYKDSSYHRSGSSTPFQLEEAKRRLEDENRRSRRKSHHVMPPPSNCFQSGSNSQSTSYAKTTPDTAPVVFIITFCDEKLPYRSKVSCLQPTLKHFKDALPKKGNFRFFFKTHCDDPENPIIQEEIVNDSDILPFFEGKVMGLVKPFD